MFFVFAHPDLTHGESKFKLHQLTVAEEWMGPCRGHLLLYYDHPTQ